MRINRRELLVCGGAMAAVPFLSASAVAGDIPEAEVPEDAIILVAEIKAKKGEEDAVKAALVAMVEPTRKEDGCLCYNLHESAKDKTQFMFYEQWANKEAFEKHGKTPHMDAMRQGINGRVEKGGATFYDLIG